MQLRVDLYFFSLVFFRRVHGVNVKTSEIFRLYFDNRCIQIIWKRFVFRKILCVSVHVFQIDISTRIHSADIGGVNKVLQLIGTAVENNQFGICHMFHDFRTHVGQIKRVGLRVDRRDDLEQIPVFGKFLINSAQIPHSVVFNDDAVRSRFFSGCLQKVPVKIRWIFQLQQFASCFPQKFCIEFFFSFFAADKECDFVIREARIQQCVFDEFCLAAFEEAGKHIYW